VTIMRALHVARRFVFPRLILPVALAAALLASLGCASHPTDTSVAAEKAYGAQMAKKGFWREALFRFQKAQQQAPNDAEIQSNLAVAYEAVGETAKALAAYRRALELAPEETHIRRNYARFAEYYTAAQRSGAGPDASPAPRPTPKP
jgi:Tfp pilus assembly protein PilF